MAAAKKKPAQKRPRAATGYVEPSTRVFTDWTEAKIKQAEIAADRGDLRQAANLCDWLLTDDRVASALTTRVQSLLGLEPTFEASGDKRRSNRAVKALEADEDWWAAYPETELALLHIWGLLLGVAPAAQFWEPDEDHKNRWMARPAFWHPQHIRQDATTKRWFVKVASQGTATTSFEEVEIEPGDPAWLLHTPYGKNRPWAMGLWRPLARMTLQKQLARGDWSRAGEKGALLALTMAIEAADSYSDGAGIPKDTQRQLATDIYNRGRNGVAALPPGVELKSVDTVVKAMELYGSPIEAIDAAIAIVIRGGNLGTLAEGGSRAAAEVQERTADLPRLRFDAQSLTTTIHDQSLTHWAEFNFGDRKLAPWPVYPVEPEEDLRGKAETEEKALGNVAQAEKLGFDVDRKAFLEEHKIGWAKPGKKVEPVAPVPPPDDGTEDPPPDGDPSEDNDPKPPPPPPEERSIEARAGTGKRKNNGEEYIDRLHAASSKHGARQLMPTVAALIAEVEKADGYEGLREAIAKRYADLAAPVKLAEITEAALTLAQLGGHLSVDEES